MGKKFIFLIAILCSSIGHSLPSEGITELSLDLLNQVSYKESDPWTGTNKDIDGLYSTETNRLRIRILRENIGIIADMSPSTGTAGMANLGINIGHDYFLGLAFSLNNVLVGVEEYKSQKYGIFGYHKFNLNEESDISVHIILGVTNENDVVLNDPDNWEYVDEGKLTSLEARYNITVAKGLKYTPGLSYENIKITRTPSGLDAKRVNKTWVRAMPISFALSL